MHIGNAWAHRHARTAAGSHVDALFATDADPNAGTHGYADLASSANTYT